MLTHLPDLRALMGMHQFDTFVHLPFDIHSMKTDQWHSNFTLDPRGAMDHRNVSRGLGNQVTVEFNLLYRFHCAISRRDEKYTEDFMKEAFAEMQPAKSTSKEAKTPAADPKQAPKASKQGSLDIKNLSIGQFGALAAQLKKGEATDPWSAEFGLKDDKERSFKRNTITGLFDDEKMIRQLKESMDDPICEFNPPLILRGRGCWLTGGESEFWPVEYAKVFEECGDYGDSSGKEVVSRI